MAAHELEQQLIDEDMEPSDAIPDTSEDMDIEVPDSEMPKSNKNKAKPLLDVRQLQNINCGCSWMCLAQIGSHSPQVLENARKKFSSKPSREQFKWIVEYLNEHTIPASSNQKRRFFYLLGGTRVCEMAWKLVLGIRDSRFQKIKKRVVDGLEEARKPNADRAGILTEKAEFCIQWMRLFAKNTGDKMPNESKTRLPASSTKHDIYKDYAQDATDAGMEVIHCNHFYKIWNKHLKDIVIARDNSGFATCDTCDALRRQKEAASTSDEREETAAVIREHQMNQRAERAKYYHHITKSIDPLDKNNYLSIIMDGMDQEKTQLPHLNSTPKSAGQFELVGVHLTGVIVHGRAVFGYFDYGQWPHSANMNATILLDVLAQIKPLPPVLYLQLDNAADNKNQFLLGLFCFLVENKVFRKIKVNFLMVGHTHENIDQMFSCFNDKLKKTDAFNLAALMNTFEASYHYSSRISPKAVALEQVYDFKEWIEPHKQKMKHHAGPHCYKIELDNNSRAVIYWKHWSTCPTWEPMKSQDDENPYFLVSPPESGTLPLAPTQYNKVLKVGEQDTCEQSPVVASIKKSYSIMKDNPIEQEWEQWINETKKAVEEERIAQRDGFKSSAEFPSFQKIMDTPEQRPRHAPRSAGFITSASLPENQPIKPPTYGRANRIFRCKKTKSDPNIDGRYEVGDLVLLHVSKWMTMNQVGEIVELSASSVTIKWYDGMPTTVWKLYTKRQGRKVVPSDPEVVSRDEIISDGFKLTKTGHLPGDVREAIQEYWENVEH